MEKPTVGVVYSDIDSDSAESKNLGLYLAAHLAATGVFTFTNIIILSECYLHQSTSRLRESGLDSLHGIYSFACSAIATNFLCPIWSLQGSGSTGMLARLI